MGRRTFVSYSREDAVAVEALVRHLTAGGHDVWLDRRIGGGHDWWNTILQEIRERDVVVVAVSPASVESAACAAELEYAVALRRALVPVAVVAGVSGRRLPSELARLQVINYHEHTPEAAIELVRVVDSAPPPPPLPDPLPVPPPVPMSYMVALQERLASPAAMSAADQASTIVRLKTSLLDDQETADARALLEQMLRRDDLLASSQREIGAALAAARPSSSLPPPGGAMPRPSPITPAIGAAPIAAPARKRHTGLIVGASVAATVIVLAVIGAMIGNGDKRAGGSTTSRVSTVRSTVGAITEPPGSTSTTPTVLDAGSITPGTDAGGLVTVGPTPASFAQVEEATILPDDFPQGTTAAGAATTAPCSDEPALSGVPVVAVGSNSIDGTFVFASQAGSFATAAEAADFVHGVGARGTCTFVHADGTVEQVTGVQAVPGLPAGASSSAVDYVVTLPTGHELRGRDAYLAIGRFVGVFTCAGAPSETDALAEACGDYGAKFGTKVGALFDKFG